MAQRGQFLEIMMANLQSYLGPEGIEVKLREKFYNPESGKQIGEIDITVRGEFGASTFLIGIECRDRPAQGPQGLPWIREIVGKKDQLRPDKMVAVSSTGFTEDAEQYAAQKSIDLITLTEPTEKILREWFEVLDICYTDWRYTITKPLTLNLVDLTRKPPAETLNFGSMDAVFIIPPFGMPRSLDSLVTERIHAQLGELNSGEGAQRIQVIIPPPLSVKLNGRLYALQNAVTQVDLMPTTHCVRALFNACNRLTDGRTIALTSTTRIMIKHKEMTLVTIAKKDNNHDQATSIRMHFYDSTGKPTTLPDGVVMAMTYE